jgi:hypothetical protein
MTRKKCLYKLSKLHPIVLLVLCLLGSTNAYDDNSFNSSNTDSSAIQIADDNNATSTTQITSLITPTFTTTTTTTTTTTAESETSTESTTTTTTTTTPSILRLELTEFLLYNASYKFDIINLDYSIRADLSSPLAPESLFVNIEIKCRSRDYDQAWSRPVELSLSRHDATKGHVQMLPLSQNAAPGSIIDCSAYVITNSPRIFIDNLNSSSIQLVIGKYSRTLFFCLFSESWCDESSAYFC